MDEFQNIWSSHNDKHINEQHFDQDQLAEQLINEKNNAIHKINKVMRIDAIVMVVVTSLFITVTFILNLESKYTISFLLFAMMSFLGLHYWIKHYIINKYDFKNENIAGILTKKLKYLEWNRHAYIYGVPTFSFGFYLYLQTILMNVNFDNFSVNSIVFLKYSLSVPFAIGIYFFTKWLYKRLFSKELKILEDIVDQFNKV